MTTTQTQTEDERRYDGDEILRDGQTYRRPMTVMDAEQQDIAAITRAALASAYSSTSGALHRPGTIVADGIEAALAATERDVRRNLRLDTLSSAWRNPPPQEHEAAVQQDQASAAPLADVETVVAERDRRLTNAWKGAA